LKFKERTDAEEVRSSEWIEIHSALLSFARQTWGDMLMRHLLLLACFAIPASAAGQTPDAAPLAVSGLEAYQRAGAQAAFDVWLANVPAKDAERLRAELLPPLHRMEERSGRFQGYDALGAARLGPHYQRQYFVLRYEKSPLFMRFDAYYSSGVWIFQHVSCDANPAKILPPAFFVPPGMNPQAPPPAVAVD
jgi:hypothetical protein